MPTVSVLYFSGSNTVIKGVKASAAKEFTLNKYRITDRMYNRVADSEPEVLAKVKSYEFKKKI